METPRVFVSLENLFLLEIPTDVFFSLKLELFSGLSAKNRKTMTTQRQGQYIKSQLWLLNRICQTIQGWETQTGNTANATKHEFFDRNRGSLIRRSFHPNQSPHTHTKITIVRTKGSLRQDCRLVVDPCKDLLATIPSSLSASSRGVEGDEVKLQGTATCWSRLICDVMAKHYWLSRF